MLGRASSEHSPKHSSLLGNGGTLPSPSPAPKRHHKAGLGSGESVLAAGCGTKGSDGVTSCLKHSVLQSPQTVVPKP